MDENVIPIGKKKSLGKSGRAVLGGQDAPFGSRDNEPEELPDWWVHLDRDKKGMPTAVPSNAVVALQRSGLWRGLRFNELRSEPVLESFPLIEGMDPPKPGPLDDYAVYYITHWLACSYQIRVGTNTAHTAIEMASKAKGRAFHPVKQFLRGLQWDGQHRIGRWLHTYCAAKDDDYTSNIGRKWMIGAVARAMQESSFVKNMLILEGDQNLGKSTMLKLLCYDEKWFADTPIDLAGNSADKYQVLRGKWIYEIAELDGFKGRDFTKVKAFISSKTDTFRKSYGRGSQDVERRCVLVGTTNDKYYLSDPTGNVRYWPVWLNKIDFDAIKRDRDQLWAEAMVYYMDGAEWYISDPAITALAKEETEAREEEDVWTPAVEKWLRDLPSPRKVSVGFTTADALKDAVDMPLKDHNGGHQGRIGRVLRKLGCVSKPGKDRPRRYLKLESEMENEQ